jgi:hypothetical protein
VLPPAAFGICTFFRLVSFRFPLTYGWRLLFAISVLLPLGTRFASLPKICVLLDANAVGRVDSPPLFLENVLGMVMGLRILINARRVRKGIRLCPEMLSPSVRSRSTRTRHRHPLWGTFLAFASRSSRSPQCSGTFPLTINANNNSLHPRSIMASISSCPIHDVGATLDPLVASFSPSPGSLSDREDNNATINTRMELELA